MERIWIEMCVKSNKKPLVGCFVVRVSACWMHHLETSHCLIPAPEDYVVAAARSFASWGRNSESCFCPVSVCLSWHNLNMAGHSAFFFKKKRTHYHRDWPFSDFDGWRLSRNSVVSSGKFCNATWNQIPGARTLWQLNFVRRRVIFVGPEHWTFFISHFWRLKFWSDC